MLRQADIEIRHPAALVSFHTRTDLRRHNPVMVGDSGAEARLKLLLDTNAFIALEPTSTTAEAGLLSGGELLRLAHGGGHDVFIAESTRTDLARDRNVARRQIRLDLMTKYQHLSVVHPSADLIRRADSGKPHDPVTNDGVDLELLAAVDVGAVDYLVTEDVKLRRRARRAGLYEKVLPIAEAAELLRNLLPGESTPPPAIEILDAYQLNFTDEIFSSLRADYADFDGWLRKIVHQHRKVHLITDADGHYAALMILKDEPDDDLDLPGRVMKVSTLKVAEHARGRKYGELLLKHLFAVAHSRSFDYVYLTAHAKQEELMELLAGFGFETHEERRPTGEAALVKRLRPGPNDVDSPLTAHIRYGPPFVDARSNLFVVPVQPHLHDRLFPDASNTLQIWTGETPYGNALRKAYISRSKARLVREGDALLFYQSGKAQAVTVVGVVEEVRECATPEEVLRFVSRRTVYSVGEIERMSTGGMIHAMLFRQDRMLPRSWSLDELISQKVLRGAPQSITRAKEVGARWVHQQLGESL